MFGRRKNNRNTTPAPVFPVQEPMFRDFVEVTHSQMLHARKLCYEGRAKTAARFLDELEWLFSNTGQETIDDVTNNATRRLSAYGKANNDNLGQVYLLRLFGFLTEHGFFRQPPEQGLLQ